ncbi:uncharacterized protein TRIVIDRAFT_187845 [Trichoderma virens Gv29-8]|uniref:Zn(2)-C6 fungal-type domain-containing protein n=1 Tax=Hypocrea virens (strain Gv29-8 / FGSC 10586) TaxID=413071 RepID=G9MEN9_HYPVG|nr:uncharacterized protein TRIVIDRAFT_187845 [Trichoderma virens Gv29-8]EHK26857.1 hypothetical protein TRIVIDRAFT_187845 [Trichoderma virens Gv29-8]
MEKSTGPKRNATACEHCRTAKAKCQPSEQPGVCLASRRECVSRTKARPRRARRTLSISETEPPTQTLGQPSTFSIDYLVPIRSHVEDDFETLRDLHNSVLDSVLDTNDSIDILQTTTSRSTCPASSSTQTRSVFESWRKPQFNMASAETLLHNFSSMLEYIPFIVLPASSTVTHVAATRPFTLLAILTVASRSRTVQKHSLYDEEFLRVLGLKYVSGGERSLHLLQGLLIYCSWYPFHLKPKSSRLVQCMRMAADIVHDLGLDEDFLTSDPWGQGVTEEELEKIRAYLAYVYLVSTYVAVWKGDKCVHTRVPPWAGTAIDILEQNAQVDGDRTLAALVRLSRLCYDATDAINERENQTVRNSQLILVGIEQQYQQLRNSMLAACPTLFAKEREPVRLQIMFLDIFLDTGSLLALPVAKTSLSAKVVRFPPPVSKIQSGVKKIRAYLDYISELDDNSILSFTINDWTRLITALTLAFRLSFPLSQCPELNWEWANSEIQLDQFLSKVSREADATIASNGVLSANRAVLGVLKSKYNRRLSSLSEQPVYPTSRTFGCPMMSGGTIIAESQWNAGFDHASEPSTDSDVPEIIPMFPDVWATMAAGLQDIEEISWDSFDEGLPERQ